jgi:hypothetical protein
MIKGTWRTTAVYSPIGLVLSVVLAGAEYWEWVPGLGSAEPIVCDASLRDGFANLDSA